RRFRKLASRVRRNGRRGKYGLWTNRRVFPNLRAWRFMTALATTGSTWDRFQKYYFDFPDLGLAIDLSRSDISDEFIARIMPKLDEAFEAMKKLEAGAIANPDE